MTEIPSRTELLSLRRLFQEKKETQTELVLAHERSENFGMAYLALWAILEDFSTRLGPLCQRVQLKTELVSWLAYLDGTQANAPMKISSGKFDISSAKSVRIPSESLLQQIFHQELAPQFYLALATKKKYRERRNAIAHSGDATSARVYDEFRAVAFVAIAEIEYWLNRHAVVAHAVPATEIDAIEVSTIK